MSAGAAAGEDDPCHARERRGAQAATASGSVAELPITRSSLAADVHENSGEQHREHEVRPAVRDERQRQPGRRQQTDHDADVQERREHRGEREPDGDELQERRARLSRDAESEQRVQREGDRDAAIPTKPHSSPTLLADEVAVRKRDEVRLLHSLAESAAEPAARADGDQRLRAADSSPPPARCPDGRTPRGATSRTATSRSSTA